MKRASLIIFAFFFVLTGQTYSDTPWWLDNTETVPQNPTSSDVVSITLSGEWGNSCTPNDSNVTVIGNDIYFDVIHDYPPDTGCAQVITGWELIESVGPLAIGTYAIYARLIEDPLFPGPYIQTGEFIVTDYQFLLSTESLTVPEGETATFTVALCTDPLGATEVTVANQSGDTDITIESGGTLFFDPCDYSVPQTVTLAAAEDEDYFDGTALISISTPNFLTSEVVASEADNDMPPVLYVDADASGNGNGKSWMDAFNDLKEALSVASVVPGVEEIHVAEGVYTPAEQGGSRNATFQLVSGVAVKGGYAGFGESDPNARDIQVYKTTLSGDLNGDDGPNFTNNEENSYHVVKGSGSDATAVLNGFTITGGGGSADGGGMYNRDSNTAPKVVNCTFKGNSATYGGGIYCGSGSSLTLENCIISENEVSWYGGGIHCWSGGNVMLTNCIFRGNSAGEGGGIYSFNTNFTLTNCVFSGNSAIGGDRKEGYGGGMYHEIGPFTDETSVITNCSFIGNSAVAVAGGGVYDSTYPLDSLTLTNCILWGNSTSNGMGESAQIYADNKNPIVNYCCVQGWTGGLGGSGNISDDPLFVDANGPDNIAGTKDDNLRLSADSPCIDTGDSNSVPPDTADLDNDGNTVEPIPWDLDGRDRFADGDCNDTDIVDMGAYEFTYAYFGDFDGECDVDFVDYAILANYWMTDEFLVDIAPTPAGDGIVDEKDLAMQCDNWLFGK